MFSEKNQHRQMATASFSQLGKPVVKQRLVRVAIFLAGYSYILAFIFHLNLKRGIIGTITSLLSPSLFGSAFFVYSALIPIVFAHFRLYQVERIPHTGYFQGLQLLLRDQTSSGLLICSYFASANIFNFVLSKILIGQRPSFWIYPEEYESAPQFNPFYLINNFYIFFLGVTYAIYLIVNERLHLQFPIIEQHRVYTIKDRLPDSFWKAIKFSWSFLARFWLLYLLFGHGIYTTVTAFMSYFVNIAPYSLRNPLWSPNSMAFMFLSGSFTILSWELTTQLFEIIFTESTKINELSLDPNACLIDGLKTSNSVYLKYLAYRELYSVCNHNQKQRKAIYKDISRSTGSAWQQISQQCIGVLNATTTALKAKNEAPVPDAKKPIAPNPSSKITDKSAEGKDSQTNKEDQPSHDIFKVPSNKNSKKNNLNSVVNAVGSHYSQGIEEYVLTKLRDTLLQSSFGKKVLSQTIQGHTFSVFSNFEIQVYAIRSLTILIQHSLTEDDFGVVQKDIPNIMSDLSNYLAQLELFVMDPKGTNYSNKQSPIKLSNTLHPTSTTLNQLAYNSQLTHPQAHALIQVARNCIYIIVITFYDHLDEFKFSPGVKQHLDLFAKFQA